MFHMHVDLPFDQTYIFSSVWIYPLDNPSFFCKTWNISSVLFFHCSIEASSGWNKHLCKNDRSWATFQTKNMRTVNASQYFFVDCSKYMCSVSDSQYFVVDLGYRLAIFDLKNTDSSVIILWIFEPDETHRQGLLQNVETDIVFCFINRHFIICKHVFDVWFWLKISSRGFLTLSWTGIPIKNLGNLSVSRQV